MKPADAPQIEASVFARVTNLGQRLLGAAESAAALSLRPLLIVLHRAQSKPGPSRWRRPYARALRLGFALSDRALGREIALWLLDSGYPGPGFSRRGRLAELCAAKPHLAGAVLDDPRAPWDEPRARPDLCDALTAKACQAGASPMVASIAEHVLRGIPPSAPDLVEHFRRELERACPKWHDAPIDLDHPLWTIHRMSSPDALQQAERARAEQRAAVESWELDGASPPPARPDAGFGHDQAARKPRL